MQGRTVRHSLGPWAVLALLWLPSSFGWAQTAGPGTQADCRPYRQGEVTTLPIGVFHVPEMLGGTMEPYQLRVRPEYLFRFFGANMGGSGEFDNTALFVIDIATGLPPTDEAQRGRPSVSTHFRLLVKGLAYGRPGFALGSLAGAPIGEPLEVDAFEVIGDGPAGFSEVRVEGQAERVSAEAELFAEVGLGGEPSALLKCARPGTVPNPHCQFFEQVGLFATETTFRRAELSKLDLIRERVAGFIACLTEE